ncbi:DEAD/DEAH box helicase [Psychroflexus montanilacus]|uniref:DEAD/DEAH box helicase n=1 Tax=Psychroflexus montanilacus TaxID=2873598 RepID=UPI001CCC17B4|nr:DEAD/DEAH box helicase [Psychroflexus montanilacus]MBZ9650481.1 DEAD/DEAH box helicase [Psychroflexus montanilacus]
MSKQFSELNIEESLQKALSELRISIPTEVQKETIPHILNQNQDLVVLSKTGTGKTAAYGLPLLQLLKLKTSEMQVLVLAPTRELAQQIHQQLVAFAQYSDPLPMLALTGGTPIKSQVEALKQTPSLIVATPGRLLDLVKREAIDLSCITHLVLDEADEMLSALKTEVDSILKALPKTRRTFLFTATLPGSLKQIIQNAMSPDVLQINVGMSTVGHQGIDHRYVVVEPIEKLEVLLYFLNSRLGQRGIIFCKTKAAVNKLAKKLAINKFSSGAIHGSLTQGIRDRVLGQFREGHIDILVATDLAARGIDVKAVSFVVNYHLPDTYEAYVHRSGRTARAGAEGLSFTVLQQDEVVELANFESELGITFHEVTKADPQSLEENNALLWAKKIFKTKPNREVSSEFRTKIQSIFHHLTKEELIDKVLAYQLAQAKTEHTSTEPSKK